MTYEQHEKERQGALRWWGMLITLTAGCGALAWVVAELSK